ncbi:MAG: BON domain-containing protein [Candidatus Eremiobacteraeota bacterium]|nr:BON domain-containing protein [Candidatus Eremiobacteraeota bacterium]
MKRYGRWLGWVIAACVAAGCSPAQQQQTRASADDALTLAQVRAKITAVDPATISLVHVSVASGVVTLRGQTQNAAQRSKIIAAARSVPTVRSVVDRLSLNARAPTGGEMASDLGLEARVKGSIARDAGINALRVRVSVHKGVITLEGELPTSAMHAVVLDAAKGVRSGARVIDRIRVAR